jgi:hypothetical protein
MENQNIWLLDLWHFNAYVSEPSLSDTSFEPDSLFRIFLIFKYKSKLDYGAIFYLHISQTMIEISN